MTCSRKGRFYQDRYIPGYLHVVEAWRGTWKNQLLRVCDGVGTGSAPGVCGT
jgi:hypothetical protein